MPIVAVMTKATKRIRKKSNKSAKRVKVIAGRKDKARKKAIKRYKKEHPGE